MGPKVAEVSANLGTPFMPWQRYVSDTAMEIDPVTKRLVYREIILLIPRQSGKTTLLLATMVQRAIGWGIRQRILYAAQTLNDARKKWEDEHVEMLEASPLYNPMFTVRKGLGKEQIRWNNGSRHGITASTEKAGHGEVLDWGAADEAWAQADSRLEEAYKPAMVTRARYSPQIWITSTAGTEKSLYLREKVKAGRNIVDSGLPTRTAYFEWSLPNEADPFDRSLWPLCMPAVGHTIELETIEADFETMKLADFRRAYLNQWPGDFPTQWLIIPEAHYNACADMDSAAGAPVAVAVDVTPDRAWASLALCGAREDGLRHIEISEHREGTGWIIPALRNLALALNDKLCAVVIHPQSPAGSLIPLLEKEFAKYQITTTIAQPNALEYAQSCGQFYDAFVPATGSDTTVRHDPTLEHAKVLTNAVAGVTKKDLGEGAWKWDRKGTLLIICPVIAATLALWGHTMHSGGKKKPQPWVLVTRGLHT